jgi:CheY-like chemotaxis protein
VGSADVSQPPSGPRLLVVDDMPTNLRLLARMLGARGFDVDTADSGEAALAKLGSARYDLILLDLLMPGIGGEAVLDAVRAKFTQIELPVLIATAATDPDTMIRLLGKGANDYVTKPFDPGVLLARVSAQLRVHGEGIAHRQALESAKHDEFEPGAKLAGKYLMGERLGSGGFGTVHRAWNQELGVHVAVKAMHRIHIASPTARQRFERESQNACNIHHPNAVQVFDFGATPRGVPYMVMELLHGYELIDEVEALPINGSLPLPRVAEIVVPLTSVLETAHGLGIIHRDVKLENIYCHRGPQGEVIKVLDFGIAKLKTEADGLTSEHHVVGTPAYMAAERLRGEKYDQRADIFSVGVVAYLMLTRNFPFQVEEPDLLALALKQLSTAPTPIRRYNQAISEQLEGVLLATLAVDPAKRPKLSAIRAAVEKALTS